MEIGITERIDAFAIAARLHLECLGTFENDDTIELHKLQQSNRYNEYQALHISYLTRVSIQVHKLLKALCPKLETDERTNEFKKAVLFYLSEINPVYRPLIPIPPSYSAA